MTIAEIETRLRALEKNVKLLLSEKSNGSRRKWWREDAGHFADDPAFDEIVRLGRQHRRSTRKRVR